MAAVVSKTQYQASVTDILLWANITTLMCLFTALAVLSSTIVLEQHPKLQCKHKKIECGALRFTIKQQNLQNSPNDWRKKAASKILCE